MIDDARNHEREDYVSCLYELERNKELKIGMAWTRG
jgi:hypothetical protein